MFHFLVPEELQNGQYSDIVSVWHNPYGFTLDFAVLDQAREDGDGNVVVPAHVNARMKIPASVIFQIARAIAENVDTYENTFGPITQGPGGPLVLPSDFIEGDDGDDDDDGG